MTGVDRYGFELSVETERGPRPDRIAFPEPIATPGEARAALVSLVGEARASRTAASAPQGGGDGAQDTGREPS